MSRGHGRVQRAILEAVAASRDYGTTIPDLVWRCYPGEEATEAHAVAVRRAVRRLIAEGRVIEQAGFYGRRLSPAPPAKPPTTIPKPARESGATAASDSWLQCVACEVQWRRDSAPACWSCGGPGSPASPPAPTS
jgi:hypothetical protein